MHKHFAVGIGRICRDSCRGFANKAGLPLKTINSAGLAVNKTLVGACARAVGGIALTTSSQFCLGGQFGHIRVEALWLQPTVPAVLLL